jgi:transglutaminase-like putative cysteine protease
MMLDPPRLIDVPALADRELDLDAAGRVIYLLEQSFRYDYPSPAVQLRHRLLVLPPARHGSQYLRAHRLEVHGASARRATRVDSRGNTVVRLSAERVQATVQFQVGALLERVRDDGPARLPLTALTDPRLLRPTTLTAPDERLRDMATALTHPGGASVELAAEICRTVHTAMTYQYGVTSIRTTAADALAGGLGVCQDSAHIMLALCHLLAIPARYVSGHLLGQGGTHAWVEVITASADHAITTAFDPCNGRVASARYLTVATGRDYADVAPTSGYYTGAPGARLTTDRRLAVLDIA